MSLWRFTLYFVAVMACGVTAFPHWSTAHSAAAASDRPEGVADQPAPPAPPKAPPPERRKSPPRPA